jgi:prolyl 4-hydroxylase
VSELLGAPSRDFESIEVVRYEPGQHYVWHADEYSWRRVGWSAGRTDPVQVLSGPRVLTMFFYLSDVEEGGHTGFMGAKASHAAAVGASAAPFETKSAASKVAAPPSRTEAEAALMVRPEKGKAILWANMQEDWRKAEPAAVHKAFPVRKGVKWAATLWVHAAGFRIPELYAGRQCASRS